MIIKKEEDKNPWQNFEFVEKFDSYQFAGCFSKTCAYSKLVKQFSCIDMKFAIQELIFGADMLASLIDLNPACHTPTQR